MCGISGIRSLKPVNYAMEKVIADMTDALVYRGPNDRGVISFFLKNGSHVALGHRRLKIIDLTYEQRCRCAGDKRKQ